MRKAVQDKAERSYLLTNNGEYGVKYLHNEVFQYVMKPAKAFIIFCVELAAQSNSRAISRIYHRSSKMELVTQNSGDKIAVITGSHYRYASWIKVDLVLIKIF